MNLLESIRIAVTSLSANKLRAALTMLGIIIGVAAVIIVGLVGRRIGGTGVGIVAAAIAANPASQAVVEMPWLMPDKYSMRAAPIAASGSWSAPKLAAAEFAR